MNESIMHLRSRLLSEQQFCIPICAHNCKKNEVKFSSQTISPRHASDYDTVHPRLSEPHLSESSFIRTHKYGCEYHYMLVNLINEYEYCLHVIHLSRSCALIANYICKSRWPIGISAWVMNATYNDNIIGTLASSLMLNPRLAIGTYKMCSR